MAFVPGFQYDLFISYAREDNANDWVTTFEKALTKEIKVLLGRPFCEETVFLDIRRMSVGLEYPSELDDSARSSAMLLTLLSANYSNSDWCSRERKVFKERLPDGAAFQSCLAAVRIRPNLTLPAQLSNAQQFDFVMPDREEPYPPGSAHWEDLVKKLASRIRSLLEELRSHYGAVFVGSPLHTDMSLRENLAADLANLHFRATPKAAQLEDRAASQVALREARCAVHFIGGSSDEAMERIEDSLECCKGPTILYQPYAATLTEREELFLVNCPSNAYPEVLKCTPTELRAHLKALLTQSVPSSLPARAPTLALVCDAPDLTWATNFAAPDLELAIPSFLQQRLGPSARTQQWEDFIRRSHAQIFYHGHSDAKKLEKCWALATKENPGALRRWYLAEPSLAEKRIERPSDREYPEGLDDFLASVRLRAAAL